MRPLRWTERGDQDGCAEAQQEEACGGCGALVEAGIACGGAVGAAVLIQPVQNRGAHRRLRRLDRLDGYGPLAFVGRGIGRGDGAVADRAEEVAQHDERQQEHPKGDPLSSCTARLGHGANITEGTA
ncbi:hypothetical protein EKD16_22120 [Streptomonospora litoralis]|uniref:Uncharacterized protein n=1 Tax=Streptomonospora litoralis TaxID=2498135 RepID=A0A4P6QAC6_9ACTN|nr:hypothetical protein EKD16_22120 [Streptomonospora litoralis]